MTQIHTFFSLFYHCYPPVISLLFSLIKIIYNIEYQINNIKAKKNSFLGAKSIALSA